MTRDVEMKNIRRLIGMWISEIRAENLESYFDINKVSEHLCRQLLNLIYDYELLNLNTKENPNFPGLDIGDKTKAKIAYQVTSRTDNKKIIENLETVVSKTFDKIFTAGIKFLILNDYEKVKFGKRAKQPSAVLATFNLKDDIVYPEDIVAAIGDIYEKEADLLKFSKIKLLLEKELKPNFPAASADQQTQGIEAIKQLLTDKSQNLDGGGSPDFSVSSSFFSDNLEVPQIKNLIERNSLVDSYLDALAISDALWIHGPFSTGKTSIAITLSQKLTVRVLWLECRGIEEDQLIKHLLTALTACYKIKFADSFGETINAIVAAAPSGTTFIFNDFPQLNPVGRVKAYIGKLFKELSNSDFSMVITSNFMPPSNFVDDEGLSLDVKAISPFTNEETGELLAKLGASKIIENGLKALITTSTHGHPLLIRSAINFLKEKDWKITEDDLIKIFTGKFDPSTDKTTYAKLLELTTDAKTRELLYRLKYIIGSFDSSYIDVVASISPAIDKAGERLNELNETWLQENHEGHYQLSPLIRHLPDDIADGQKKSIYEGLAKHILNKRRLSPIDASTAILYFSFAGKNNSAALVLIKVLSEFVAHPKWFFEWGMDIHWYRSEIPQDVSPHFQIHIRSNQLLISQGREEDTKFLVADLKRIMSGQNLSLLDKFLGSTVLFQYDLTDSPLKAMDELALMASSGEQLKKIKGFESIMEDHDPTFTGENLQNGVWLVFVHLSKMEEYKEWFNKLNIEGNASLSDPETNAAYSMAGVSIYRNLVLPNLQSGNVVQLLEEIIELSTKYQVYLLAAYGIKYLIKHLAENENNIAKAIETADRYQQICVDSYIYSFLILTELGRQCFLRGDEEKAFFFTEPFLEVTIPDFYTEQVDYQIGVSQLYFKSQPALSAEYSMKALMLAKDNPIFVVDDTLKLFGEAGIGLAHTNKYKEALYVLAEGFERTLDSFKDNDEYKALIIRYGNTIMYVVQYLSLGRIKDFGEGNRFVIPEPGFFYKDNQKLLEDGFYFDERKFMVSTITNDGFELVFDYENARKWAYKSIEYGVALTGAQFLPIIQKFIYYPVADKQFRQAYNLLAIIEQFYADLQKKVVAGNANPSEKEIIEKAQTSRALQDDFGVYLFILFPSALDFSLRIAKGELSPGQFQSEIDAVFEKDRFNPIDPEEFKYAKSVFEKIMIDRIGYDEFRDLNNMQTGKNREFIYAIGCFLLSSFTGATEAANLQLANVVTLEKSFQTMIPAFYNFQVIPYFEEFWIAKFNTHRKDFSTTDHLETKGFPLVARTAPEKKVRKLFKVITNHLDVYMTKSIEEFIDID